MWLNSWFQHSFQHSAFTRLLQLAIVSSARVNYSASAARDECSGSSHNEFVAVRPCETSFETVTLAACRLSKE